MFTLLTLCAWKGVCCVREQSQEGCQPFVLLSQQKLLEKGQKCGNYCGERRALRCVV